MAARRARKHTNEAKRARRDGIRPIDPDDLPRPLRLVLEGQEQLADYVAASTDRDSAIALAETRLDAALDRLVDLMSRYYAMDVAELVHIRNLTADPETYSETEHEGNLAAVEVAALVAGAVSPPDHPLAEVRHVPAEVVREAQRAATDALEAASMKVLLKSAEDPSNALAPIGFGALVREMTLRNTAYPHMLRDTLMGLFGAPAIEADLVAATGLTVAEVLAFVDASDAVRQRNWDERLAVLQPITPLAMGPSADPEVQELERAGLRAVFAAALASPADAGTVTAAVIASETGLSEDKAAAFIDLFSLDCSSLDAREAAKALLSGNSPLRTRPIVVDGTGRAALSHSALLVSAIRPRLEEVLTTAGADARYFKHRGDFVEAEAVRLVSSVLPSPTVHVGFEYYVPDPDAPAGHEQVGKSPRDYTKLVEGDGLIIVDDIAVIIESKAVNISAGTRMGILGGVRRNLSRVVTEVVDQAQRTRTRIEIDRGLRMRDGTWLDLSHVREIHSIAVTLEDLSGIATLTAQLVDAGLVDPHSLPWIVSVHDLRIIAELVDRPSDLLLYLRRRTHADVTRRFLAVDELDLYMHFLATGLYVEPDPDQVAAELPHLPAPTKADRRRYADQRVEFLTSRTDALDAWYFHRLGIRATPADKPTGVAPTELLRLVDAVAATGKRGWAAAVLALLEGSAEMRQALLDGLATARRLTASDRSRHTFAAISGTSASSLTVLVLASVMAPLGASDRTRLLEYMRAKKHQTKAPLGVTVIVDSSGAVLDVLYDNSPAGPDPALDELVARLGLRSLERPSPVPPKARAKQQRQEAEQRKLERERRERRERGHRHR